MVILRLVWVDITTKAIFDSFNIIWATERLLLSITDFIDGMYNVDGQL